MTNAAPASVSRAARYPSANAAIGTPISRAVLRRINGDNSLEVQRLIIAIDGPSGAGKGTVARAVAARLRYQHLDTGAMYRAVAWKAMEEGVDLRDEPAVAAI